MVADRLMEMGCIDCGKVAYTNPYRSICLGCHGPMQSLTFTPQALYQAARLEPLDQPPELQPADTPDTPPSKQKRPRPAKSKPKSTPRRKGARKGKPPVFAAESGAELA